MYSSGCRKTMLEAACAAAIVAYGLFPSPITAVKLSPFVGLTNATVGISQVLSVD